MSDEASTSGTMTHAFYANVLTIGHNAFEFLLDFGHQTDFALTPGVRVVTAPVYAKGMLEALQAAVVRYEASHGPIPDPKDDP
jgi:hypothetical protein